MSFTSGNLGGGGGGFGGFPYQSAHQQGSDGSRGNANNRRNNNRNRHERRKERGGALICEVFLKVPANLRRKIIGQKGRTVRWLTERTRTVVDVPGMKNVNPNACVKIRGSCITYVLHACWELSCILLPLNGDDGDCDSMCDGDDVCQDDTYIEYKLVIQGADTVFKGKLKRKKHYDIDHQVEDISCTTNTDKNDNKLACEKTSGAFMVGNEETGTGTGGISAFCIPTQLSQETISILVDNERFIHPNITAKFEVISIDRTTTVSKDNDAPHFTNNSGEEQNNHEGKSSDTVNHGTSESSLIFIYGSEQEMPYHLFLVLLRKTIEGENS